MFLFFFILSPAIYLTASLVDDTKRTDFPGKEISRLVQNKWDDNFVNEIKIVIGDEWDSRQSVLSFNQDQFGLMIKKIKLYYN